ncbi:hypothetical protein C882_0352 [Caenispirillum salinarum AK4]|uniref:Uncharacterized protein n=1 Tax=Caenispirillum salinarum AK4 TaxID=1238182 RepID=K9GU83_9PROT|nr:hypothetical protein C882_0352 [Caenispirillum salinarum AK4]
MAGHAGFRRRQPGRRAHFDGGVAVTAVDPQTPDVMPVAEGDGLHRRNILTRRDVGRRTSDEKADTRNERHRREQHDDTQPCVGALAEDPGHDESLFPERLSGTTRCSR